MKVALVTLDEFNMIWHKLIPQDRFMVNIPCNAIYLQVTDTLVLTKVGESTIIITAVDVLQQIAISNSRIYKNLKETLNTSKSV